ncbi:hypothetical protein [Arthrobacter sp. 4R501]|uniref:hypothetical protein n=1 Tax=Arthrobacter sp. 4R501 TaxID=2058886 RepID=UPI000CE4333E|nr:hypothetical protein [Arthrobacter sp. 4R501]
MNVSRTLPSISDLHDAGRRERKSIAFDVGVIFIGGLTLFSMLLLLLAGPRWILTAQGFPALTTVFVDAFSFLALDPSGMAQFVAIAGVILALNRFDRHSPQELGMEAAVQLSTRLDFRSLVQFVLTLIAATAPYRAMTWTILHMGAPGWNLHAAATAGACVILWLLLLLAGPTRTVFGLQGIQRQLHMNDVIHRAGRLEQAWGQRWGYLLHSPAGSRLLPLRIAANWFTIIALATIAAIFLTMMVNPGYEFWADPKYAGFALLLGIYLSVLGFTGLAAAVGFAVLSLKAENQDRPAESNTYKWLAIAVPYLFAVGTAIALGTPYVPALGAALLVTGVQHACVLGILSRRSLAQQSWNPARRLTLNLRQVFHHEAHTRWALLRRQWSSAVEKLHRRDAKKAIKEARLWRTKNGLALPFLD